MKVLERYEPLIDDIDAFYAACQRPLPSVVRVNSIKATIEQAKTALDAEGIAYEQADWNKAVLVFPDEQPGANWPYVHGWIHGQEEVSAIPAMVLTQTLATVSGTPVRRPVARRRSWLR